MAADWNDIRAEYITSGISYRQLAEKHGVSFSTLQKRAKREGWPAARRVTLDMSITAMDKAQGAAAMAIPTEEATEHVNDVAALLLAKIELTLKYVDGKKSGQTVKNCAAALKTVRDILGVKTEDEKTEQKLRLDKLRKDIEPESKETAVTVSFIGGEDAWSE